MKARLIKEAGGYDLYRIDADGKRVTFASTQDYKQKLSLKNCQAIERGYDLDELAKEECEYNQDSLRQYDSKFIEFYKEGFQKALEILGDKKFDELDITLAMHRVWDWFEDDKDEDCSSMTELRNKHIQSLQQTEWEVEIETHPREWIKKLDADGCLILKRKL